MRKILFALALLMPSMAWAQDAATLDVFKPFRLFLGSWEGASDGKPGRATVQSKVEFLFNGKFIKVSGKSVYPTQDRNPKGQTYEGFDLISYDHIRQKFILRQFSGEGFVNQYVLDQITPDGKTIVFVTESMENLPPGFHARKTYRILNEDEFTDTFELAPPGKDLEIYVETHFRRKK